MNDLQLNIQDAKLVSFVDEINILIIDKNIDAIQERLKRVLKQFELGSKITALSLILIKKAMFFHFNKTCNLVKPKIVFKNVEISYTSEGKFLGINISNNLKWNTYFQLLCS